MRWMSVVVLLSVVAGCSRTSEPVSAASPPEIVSEAPSPSTFAGAWRSVTPGLEFIRLSVHSKSSEEGVLAARLTFSGVAWEGGGRIVGDSLVTIMAVVGTTASGVMVARAADAQTLRVQMRPTSGAVTDLMFVREN
jgi:hypothetical protein